MSQPLCFLGVSLSQDLFDSIEEQRKKHGFVGGALIFKRSPFVVELLKIGLKHIDEIKKE